jgi:hypothetical protein
LYYTIYKITNKTNGKFYIGKHKTENLDDGYMGSGKLIRIAIQKHGVENFNKEILHVFETEAEMNAAEARLVVLSEESYNLCPGGHGGFGHINDGSESHIERCKKASAMSKSRNHPNWGIYKFDNSEKSLEASKRGITALMEKYPNGVFNGKKHSEFSRQKMSNTKKATGFQKGEKNSQYGKPRSEETKAKIRATLLAKRDSLEKE